MQTMQTDSQTPSRKVRVIPATKPLAKPEDTLSRPLRVAAYCRVSTEMEEQLNSYAVQTSHYTEKIKSTPNWEFAGVFADKGISGTGVKNRDEFNRMIPEADGTDCRSLQQAGHK